MTGISNTEIMITGVPRSGTTFLIQLYHELGYYTGFKRGFHHKIQKSTHKTHGGIEWAREETRSTGKYGRRGSPNALLRGFPEVIKHPWTKGEKPPWTHPDIQDMEFHSVIITKRDERTSIMSDHRRSSFRRDTKLNYKIMSRHIKYANIKLREHWQDHIEVEYPRSVEDKDYLWGQLESTFKGRVDQEQFNSAWQKLARPEYQSGKTGAKR
jgi:hypothetical protein